MLALWLLSVTATAAMPAARATSPGSCDAQTTSVRKLIRQARALGGPLSKRLRHAGIRLNPHALWLQRTPPASVHDNEQAIQNDAPTALIPFTLDLELRSLGFFLDLSTSPLDGRTHTPRAPRGPPQPA